MRDHVIPVLEEAALQTLETMCFTGVLGNAGEDERSACTVGAKVRFHGDAAGVLHVDFTPDAARNVAANFLGEEPGELAEDRIEAVVFEVANMICGSMLSQYKPDGYFELGAPEVDGAEPSHVARMLDLSYQLDSGAVRLAIDGWQTGRPAIRN